MSNDTKLSIIIATYNDAKHLEFCIPSVYQKLGDSLAWEIILVNNDRNQNIADLPLDFSKIKILNNEKNLGFGGAMNVGAKAAQGEFLLLLNPDAKIMTENINELLDEFSKDEKIGVIGGGIFDEKGNSQEWSAGKELSFFDLVINNLGFSRSRHIWNKTQKTECDWNKVLF
jgi:GT2 family glycosyltransferase